MLPAFEELSISQCLYRRVHMCYHVTLHADMDPRANICVQPQGPTLRGPAESLLARTTSGRYITMPPEARRADDMLEHDRD